MKGNTVFIIDDNAEFRQSISWMLTGMGFDTRDFENPEEGLAELTGAEACCCLLLDVRMPSMSGLEVHDELLTTRPDIPVIYMTGHGDVSLAVEAMRKGAVTFLEKPVKPDVLEAAIDRSREQAERFLKAEYDRRKIDVFRKDLHQLTKREIEVMHAIVEGKANKVTAIDLGISVKTVELHRSRVMKKLPIRSSQELVKMVMLCH